MRFFLVAWLVWIGITSLAGAQEMRWTAQDLSGRATLGEPGGILLLFATPDAKTMPFSDGRALTFSPTGKGSRVEFTLPVTNAGVYQVRFRGVVGPGCGLYRIWINGVERGNLNLVHAQTLHMNHHPPLRFGVMSKRALFVAGDNRIALELQQAGPRGSAVVLDTLEIVPAPSTSHVYRPTPYDPHPPAHENLGAELVTNGGFESFGPGDRFLRQHAWLQSWAFNSPVPREHEPIVRDASQARTGKQALLLAPDPLEDMAICMQTVPMKVARRYRVTLWARGSGMLLVYLFIPSDAPTRSTQGASNLANHFVATEQWQPFSFVVNTPVHGSFGQMTLALYATSDSRVWFDDVSVREIKGDPAQSQPRPDPSEKAPHVAPQP